MDTIFQRDEIQRRCNEFFALYEHTEGRVYEMCMRKLEHTHAVAANCLLIAEDKSLDPYDSDLAWIIGELHDFARFGQAVVTRTFRDTKQFHHAKLGARLLFHYRMVEDIIPNYSEISEADRKVLEKAVALHGDFRLPEDLSERERLFCEIIREADRMDILKISASSSWESLYGRSKEEILSSDISEEIEQAYQRHEMVEHSKRVTLADFYLGRVALFFGVKSAAAKRKLLQMGCLQKMVDVEFYDAAVQEKFARAKKCLEEAFMSTL